MRHMTIIALDGHNIEIKPNWRAILSIINNLRTCFTIPFQRGF